MNSRIVGDEERRGAKSRISGLEYPSTMLTGSCQPGQVSCKELAGIEGATANMRKCQSLYSRRASKIAICNASGTNVMYGDLFALGSTS